MGPIQPVSGIHRILHGDTYSSRDVVCGAFASNPHQYLARRKLKSSGVVRSEVALERFQQFKSVRILLDDHLSLGLWFRRGRGIELSATWGESSRWKILPARRRELEFLAIRKGNRVCHGVEAEFPGESHGCNDCRRRKEVHSLSVAVVPGLEVTVPQCEWLARRHIQDM